MAAEVNPKPIVMLLSDLSSGIVAALERMPMAEGIADDLKAAALRHAADVYAQKVQQEVALAILKATMTKAGL